MKAAEGFFCKIKRKSTKYRQPNSKVPVHGGLYHTELALEPPVWGTWLTGGKGLQKTTEKERGETN